MVLQRSTNPAVTARSSAPSIAAGGGGPWASVFIVVVLPLDLRSLRHSRCEEGLPQVIVR